MDETLERRERDSADEEQEAVPVGRSVGQANAMGSATPPLEDSLIQALKEVERANQRAMAICKVSGRIRKLCAR